jgi:dihydroflavonol-4-reductase
MFTRVKKGLPFYSKGSTGFVAVSDVIDIMYQLTKSPICGERFTIISQNITYKDFLFSIADSLKVKRPQYHATPFLMSTICKLDWLASNLLGRKRLISKATARSSYSTDLYSNEKIKNALNFKFIDVSDYINEISKL